MYMIGKIAGVNVFAEANNATDANVLGVALASYQVAAEIAHRLPRTADGVPVVPGCDHVFRIVPAGIEGFWSATVDGVEESCNWNGWAAVFASDIRDNPEWIGGHDPSKCYSTRAAALAAKEPHHGK